MTREIGKLRRSAIVALLLMAGMFWVGRASADVGKEVRHGRIVRTVCAHPNHWYREHGITIIYEGCEGA